MDEYIFYGKRSTLLKKFDKISAISRIVSLLLLIILSVFLVFELPAFKVVKKIVYLFCAVFCIFQTVFNILLVHFAKPIEREFLLRLTIGDFVNGFKSAIDGYSTHDKYYRDICDAYNRENMWSIRYYRKYIGERRSLTIWYTLLAIWCIIGS